jgi:hypothetical protein
VTCIWLAGKHTAEKGALRGSSSYNAAKNPVSNSFSPYENHTTLNSPCSSMMRDIETRMHGMID